MDMLIKLMMIYATKHVYLKSNERSITDKFQDIYKVIASHGTVFAIVIDEVKAL